MRKKIIIVLTFVFLITSGNEYFSKYILANHMLFQKVFIFSFKFWWDNLYNCCCWCCHWALYMLYTSFIICLDATSGDAHRVIPGSALQNFNWWAQGINVPCFPPTPQLTSEAGTFSFYNCPSSLPLLSPKFPFSDKFPTEDQISFFSFLLPLDTWYSFMKFPNIAHMQEIVLSLFSSEWFPSTGCSLDPFM